MANKFRKSFDKKRMKCNKSRPLRKGESGYGKKKRVVKACEGGKEKIVKFGAVGYKHNYSDSAKKSFRARHKCGQKKSKLGAQYWACKDLWPRGKKTSSPKAKKGAYRR